MKRSRKRKENYLIVQLVKGVPLEKIDTRWNDKQEETPVRKEIIPR